jgi:hypothetical protein
MHSGESTEVLSEAFLLLTSFEVLFQLLSHCKSGRVSPRMSRNRTQSNFIRVNS